MLDAADRFLLKGLNALLAVDRRAIDAAGHTIGDRVLPALDRIIKGGQKKLLGWRVGRRP